MIKWFKSLFKKQQRIKLLKDFPIDFVTQWREDADKRADRILKTHNRNKALNQLGI